MKKVLVLLCLLIGLSWSIDAQQVGSVGIVRKTVTSTPKKPKEIKVRHWQAELKEWTHSVGLLGGLSPNGLGPVALDYNAQYRFNSALSVGFGAWGGCSSFAFKDDFGVELRANVKVHPFANTSNGKRIPFLALWGGYWLPRNPQDAYADSFWSVEPWVATAEVGCDFYGKGVCSRYIALNVSMVKQKNLEYVVSDIWATLAYIKIGLRF